MSYIISIERKNGGFDSKDIIKKILKGSFSEEQLEEAKDAHDEYLYYV